MQYRRVVAGAAAAFAVAGLAATSAPGVGVASSHREAPLIAGEPQLDNTDLYAFVSPDKPDTVTFVADWIPFEEPNGGPNFYSFAENTSYDINIDNDGDARPDIIYRWKFTSHYRNRNTFLYNTGQVTSLGDPDLNFYQTYDLQRVTPYRTSTLLRNVPVAPSNTGPASFPNYDAVSNAAIASFGTKSKSFAGQADDPFFLDLRVFDLLYGADLSEVGQDTLAGYNVNTVALQVPKSDLALRGNAMRNPVIGVWTTTTRARVKLYFADGSQRNSAWPVQVSRLGMPLVNEVVVPVGLKDRFNASKPVDDAQFLPKVVKPEVPQLIQSIYGIPAPATPRNDLVEVFLTGVCKACGPVAADLNSQRLNADVDPRRFRPSEQLRLGVVGGDLAGFPNGRRLADDVIDVTLQAAEGVLLPGHPAAVDGLGDSVNANDSAFRTAFPYVALPHNNAVNVPG